MCQSFFFNNTAGSGSFIKKEALTEMFSWEFGEISKNSFPYRTLPVFTSEYDVTHFILRKTVIKCSDFSTGFSKYWHNSNTFPETFSKVLNMGTLQYTVCEFRLASKIKKVENAVFLTSPHATRLCNKNSSKFA